MAGEEDDLLRLHGLGGLEDVERAEDVGLEGLFRVLLHHADVLVGGEMEHDLRTGGLEDVLEAAAVGDVNEPGPHGDIAAGALHHLDAQLVHAGLVGVDEVEGARPVVHDAARKLGADAAGGTCDQNDAPGNGGATGGIVDVHGLAGQEVLDGDLAHLAALGSSLHDVVQPRARGGPAPWRAR